MFTPGLSLIPFKGKNYVLEVSGYDPNIRMFDVESPFCLMPEYTPEERTRRRDENNLLIEAILSKQWAREKKVQSFSKKQWSSFQKIKKYRGTTPKPTFEFKNKIEWDKAHRERAREKVERVNHPYTSGDFKNPLECKVCLDVILFGLQNGVSEEVCDLFVEQLVSLRRVSEEAADVFFSYFMEVPNRLHDYGLVSFPKKGEAIPAIHVWQSWLQELMNHRLFSPRMTGRGELGALALFRQNVHLLSSDEIGDIKIDDCNIEIKSIASRKSHIRLGSEITWADSSLYRHLATTSLSKSGLMKQVSRNIVEDQQDWIEKEFTSVENFIQRAEADLKIVLARYDRIFVYIEDENVFEEIKSDDVYFYGVSSEGRWKFSIVPNTLFQNL